VANIQVYSNNPHLTAHWTHALIGDNIVSRLTNIHTEIFADLVLIDAKKLDEDTSLHEVFVKQKCRFLIVGNTWSEAKQVEAMVKGAAGYCEAEEPADIIIRAVKSILTGDIWIQRSLVPKIISVLTSTRRSYGAAVKSVNTEELLKTFATLSVREVEVANLIQIGENNKAIAAALDISERTVKAHLSSIFRKLEVEDRLQLAIFLKEIEQYRKSDQ
jgi:DNA-binding NarL/FixJ family response regulator